MAPPKSYEKAVLKKIQEQGTKTKLTQGLLSKDDENKLPNFEVWEHSSSHKLDKPYKGNPRYLMGTDEQVAMQASMIKAIHDELSLRLGFGFTFEEWFEEWQKGFPSLINTNKSNQQLITNYPINNTENADGWRTNIDLRPQYIIKNHPSAHRKFRVIEYFPEGTSNPHQSIIFSGSDSQIINQIILYTSISVSNEYSNNGFMSPIRVKGRPMVRLYFLEPPDEVDPGFPPIKGTISVRVNKTVTNGDGFDDLTVLEIHNMAVKIIENFATPNPYIWRRGKETVTYHDIKNGIRTWIYCWDGSTGINLFKRLLDVVGVAFDLSKVKVSINQDPSTAYPIIPPTQKIFGQDIQQARKRPVGNVHFKYSKIFIQTLSSRGITLTDAKRVIFHENKFKVEEYI